MGNVIILPQRSPKVSQCSVKELRYIKTEYNTIEWNILNSEDSLQDVYYSKGAIFHGTVTIFLFHIFKFDFSYATNPCTEHKPGVTNTFPIMGYCAAWVGSHQGANLRRPTTEEGAGFL